ncbi:MAG: tetratricopeptide repeat protein [Gemmataceae bacterium]|nr:tetratricopeptide repeat protein [Gemmataceae bacterium]
MGFMPRLPRHWHERLDRWRDSIVYWCVYPIQAVISGFSWTGHALVHAWGTRSFRMFLKGIPALLGLVAVCVGGAFAFAGRSQERRSNLAMDYMNEAAISLRKANAAKENDVDTRRARLSEARTYVEKAIRLTEGTREDFTFSLANVLAESGEFEHCRAIMEKLAPEESNGFGPAHLWRGDLLMREMRADTPDVEKAIERHYVRGYESAKLKPESPEYLQAVLRLGNLYARTGRINDAIKYIEKVEEAFPQQRMLLAELYNRAGRKDDARRTLVSIERYFKAKTEEQVDDKAARFQWVGSLVQQEKYDEAIAVLKKGSVLSTDVRFPAACAEVYGQWEAWMSRQPGNNLAAQIALIQAGLQCMPSSNYLLTRLLELSNLKGAEAAKAKETLQNMLADGNSAPIIHHLLAMRAYSEGRTDEAKFHWEKSLTVDSQVTPVVMNNLAWIYCHQAKPDYDRGLVMIDQVIAKYGGQPAFYGTRGEILAKKKQYKEALPDLEKGIKAMPMSLELHASLAECYEHLGIKSMAEVHSKRADELRKKMPNRPGTPTAPAEPPKLDDGLKTKADEKPKVEEKPKSDDKPKG